MGENNGFELATWRLAMKIAGQLTVDDLPRLAPLVCRQTNPRYGEHQTRTVEVGGVRFGNGRR